MNTLNVNRRNFLKSTATIAGGLIIGFHLPQNSRFAQAADTTIIETSINAWLRIGNDDNITCGPFRNGARGLYFFANAGG